MQPSQSCRSPSGVESASLTLQQEPTDSLNTTPTAGLHTHYIAPSSNENSEVFVVHTQPEPVFSLTLGYLGPLRGSKGDVYIPVKSVGRGSFGEAFLCKRIPAHLANGVLAEQIQTLSQTFGPPRPSHLVSQNTTKALSSGHEYVVVKLVLTRNLGRNLRQRGKRRQPGRLGNNNSQILDRKVIKDLSQNAERDQHEKNEEDEDDDDDYDYDEDEDEDFDEDEMEERNAIESDGNEDDPMSVVGDNEEDDKYSAVESSEHGGESEAKSGLDNSATSSQRGSWVRRPSVASQASNHGSRRKSVHSRQHLKSLAEAEALRVCASQGHPNVVEYLDSFPICRQMNHIPEGQVYDQTEELPNLTQSRTKPVGIAIVMRYCGGGDLAQLIRNKLKERRIAKRRQLEADQSVVHTLARKLESSKSPESADGRTHHSDIHSEVGDAWRAGIHTLDRQAAQSPTTHKHISPPHYSSASSSASSSFCSSSSASSGAALVGLSSATSSSPNSRVPLANHDEPDTMGLSNDLTGQDQPKLGVKPTALVHTPTGMEQNLRKGLGQQTAYSQSNIMRRASCGPNHAPSAPKEQMEQHMDSLSGQHYTSSISTMATGSPGGVQQATTPGEDIAQAHADSCTVPSYHFTEEEIWCFLTQILLAVKHIHSHHLLHRDIKASNIFVTHEFLRPAALTHPNAMEAARLIQERRGIAERQLARGTGRRDSTSDLEPNPEKDSDIQELKTRAACITTRMINGEEVIAESDVPEDNLVPMPIDRLRIGDFGVARLVDHTSALAKTGIGTPFYLAPEVLLGRPYDRKCDIWSVGVILYELVTLKKPFKAENIATLARKVIKGDYKPPPAYYSSHLGRVLRALLQVQPEKRPDARELLLDKYIGAWVPQVLDQVSLVKFFPELLSPQIARCPVVERYSRRKSQVILDPVALMRLSSYDVVAAGVATGAGAVTSVSGNHRDSEPEVHMANKPSQAPRVDSQRVLSPHGCTDSRAQALPEPEGQEAPERIQERQHSIETTYNSYQPTLLYNREPSLRSNSPTAACTTLQGNRSRDRGLYVVKVEGQSTPALCTFLSPKQSNASRREGEVNSILIKAQIRSDESPAANAATETNKLGTPFRFTPSDDKCASEQSYALNPDGTPHPAAQSLPARPLGPLPRPPDLPPAASRSVAERQLLDAMTEQIRTLPLPPLPTEAKHRIRPPTIPVPEPPSSQEVKSMASSPDMQVPNLTRHLSLNCTSSPTSQSFHEPTTHVKLSPSLRLHRPVAQSKRTPTHQHSISLIALPAELKALDPDHDDRYVSHVSIPVPANEIEAGSLPSQSSWTMPQLVKTPEVPEVSNVRQVKDPAKLPPANPTLRRDSRGDAVTYTSENYDEVLAGYGETDLDVVGSALLGDVVSKVSVKPEVENAHAVGVPGGDEGKRHSLPTLSEPYHSPNMVHNGVVVLNAPDASARNRLRLLRRKHQLSTGLGLGFKAMSDAGSDSRC